MAFFKSQTKGGLKGKLTRLTLIPIVIVAVIMAGIAIIVLSMTYNNNYTDEAISLAHSYARNTENLIDNLSQQFNVVTHNEDIADESVSVDDKKAILNKYAELSTFKDFSLAYSDGKTLNDTDISQRDYFKSAMASKDAYISSPVLRMTDNSLTIMMGKYFSAGGQDYIAYGGLSTDIINEVLADVSFGEGGIAFIIDKDGQTIASSNEQTVPLLINLKDKENLDPKYNDLAKLSEKMLTYNEATDKTVINGEQYFVGYTPIHSDEGWSIAVATLWSPVTSTINIIAGIIIGAAVLVAIVVIIIIRRFVTRICDPIAQTAKRLSAFADGDLSSPAPSTNIGGEIQDMTEAMSSMVSTLTGCIGDIRNVLTAMAGGDFTVDTQVDYRGELNEIKTSIDVIRTEMNHTMSEVSRSAYEVKEGSSQLAEGSTQLSQNAVTQAAAVEEITSTVMDIAKKTEENNENVTRALATVRNTNDQATEGSRSMSDMLEAIGEIETSSKEIEQIMKVIDDIAFQTNILALNAAIEAARAGEAGKGFAVVADEVRNLAGKSADAAKQTGELISRSIEAVNRGADLAGTTSTALDSIVNGVAEISDVMEGIAQANAEQTAAIEQISTGMDNVNMAIHNTTATAEESAAASEELSALAVSLSDTVSHFKTEG
ncbi:MAG: methyl-accepting chemotaxis protein [Oscillospiraceae bacterium]|nr:methyl-accepting chemotaxis protein [Oscillospiraceae bacterium]